ncbi:MAG: peptidase M20, partial [Sciscionella sp.]
MNTSVRELWNGSILASLSELVAIPAVSAAFDPAWDLNGHLEKAVWHVRGWLEQRDFAGAEVEIVKLMDRGPLLMVDIPASDASAAEAGIVLLYGHLDKQPPVADWSPGLG